MSYDRELVAMDTVLSVFKGLNSAQKKRVIDWLKARFWLTLDKLPPGLSIPVQEPVPSTVSTVEGTHEDAVDDTPAKRVWQRRKKELTDFDTVLDLFAASEVTKSTDKVLLMASFLQARLNFEEITSYEISFRLKRIHQPVNNISSLINGIMKRKPPLIVEAGDPEEHTKHARRKFKVTKMGLRVAGSFVTHKKNGV